MIVRIGAFLTLALLATACGTTLQPGQMGMKNVVLSEPALQTKVLPEGFYWQWPWNTIIPYDVTLQSRDEDVEVLTKDDLHVPTTVTVTFRPIKNELYALHLEIGPNYYEDVIRPVFVSMVRALFAHHEHNDLARASPEIEATVLTNLRKKLEGKHLILESVSIKHIRYDKAVTRSVSQKLVKEQMASQKRFEVDISKQDAEIARTKAKGVGDSLRIRAEGEAAAIVLRARAQAEAQKMITKTLSKDYLKYKAFDGPATRYYVVPIGKDGLPIIINADN